MRVTVTDNRHYNRSSKRILALEMLYWTWYKGQTTAQGVIEDVKYIGNSVYGQVKVKIGENWYLVRKSEGSYRPRKNDIHEMGLIGMKEVPVMEGVNI